MKKPLVSVLIPLYNHEHYIEEALRSVLKQTFADFECLVLNDGSTDQSLSIAERVSKFDPRIKIFSQENQGVVSSLNYLFNKSSGQYVTTLDSDDSFLSHRLEEGVNRLNTEQTLVASFCSVQVVDKNGQACDKRPELITGPLCGADFTKRLILVNFLASCAGIFRADALRNAGPIARDFPEVHDWDLWLRLKAEGEMELTGDVGVRVRWDGKNHSLQNPARSAREQVQVSLDLAEKIIAKENFGNEDIIRVFNRRSALLELQGRYSDAAIQLLRKAKISPLNCFELSIVTRHLLSIGEDAAARRTLKILSHQLSQEKSEMATSLRPIAEKFRRLLLCSSLQDFQSSKSLGHDLNKLSAAKTGAKKIKDTPLSAL